MKWLGMVAVLFVMGAVGYYVSIPAVNSLITKPNITVLDLQTPAGQKVWLVETHYAPVISLSLIFRHAGSKSNPAGKVGRTILATGLFFEGAGPYDTQQLFQQILETHLQISVDDYEDELTISARFPSENLKAVTELLKLILTAPRFEENSFARAHNHTLVHWQQHLHDERKQGDIALREMIYKDHPYGNTAKDVLKDLPNLTLEDIRVYRQERLARDQLVITAVGDFVPTDFLKTIDEIIQDLPAEAKPLDIQSAEPHNLGVEQIVYLDIPQSQINFVQPGIKRSDPDFIPAVLINRLLGANDRKSIFWTQLLEKGLTYSFGTHLESLDHSQFIKGYVGTKNESAREVIQIIRQVWEKVCTSGFTAEELEFAKESVIGDLWVYLDSTMQVCYQLAFFQYHGLDPDYINKRDELIHKVTVADIKRVAQRLLKPDQLTFVIVGRQQPTQSN